MRATLLCLGLVLTFGLFSQTDAYQINAVKVADMNIDGQLDEAVWQNEQSISQFTMAVPVDTGFSDYVTVVRLAFDDKNLYVGATCYQPRNSYRIESLKRDYQGGTSDVLNIVLNPYRDGINGFIFSVNPFGVMREALIDNGANMSFDWDNKWTSEVELHDDRWTLEMAIPFRTLRYKTQASNTGWRVNFIRTMLNPWNVSTWVPVPRPNSPQSLAFSGELNWEEAPPPPKRFNTSFIPYLTTKADIDYKRSPNTLALDQKITNFNTNIGGDVKIGLTPSLNLDLTLSPDFSQVEVDRQVANLSRFELFFPELRQFFQENRDLFAFYGFPNTRPFFSRRIGLAYNPVLGRNEQVPIIAGARLSGKINNDLRVGLLNMQTKRVNWDSTRVNPASNFTVATAQHKVFARSLIGAILVNKQNNINGLTNEQKQGHEAYSRVAGLEYNLYSKDNKWEGEWYYHRSFSPNKDKRDHVFAQFLGYSARRFSMRSGFNYIGKNYQSEAGFVPRTGIQTLFFNGSHSYYPKRGAVSQIKIIGNSNTTFLLSGKATDVSNSGTLEVNKQNAAFFSFSVSDDYTYLLNAFDPTNLYREGTEVLEIGTSYRYRYLSFDYTSSRQKRLFGGASLETGNYFNGYKNTASADMSWQWQPYGIFTFAGTYNSIKLPAPYPSANFWLIGPRVELTFTKSLFFNTFLQYNTQANNLNINTRLQWRFAPVSDFYLVYTDNSYAEGIPNTDVRQFSPKNKALVAKITYWY